MVDVITILGCNTAPDDISITVFMPPIPSSVLRSHLRIHLLVLSSVTRSTAWRSALSSPLAFQKSQTMFFSRLSFLVIHFQIHFAPNLWPPTVSDSLFATCENVSISMTGWGRLLVGYRSETCHCTSLWWWCQGWGGLLWLHYLRSSGGKSRPCSAVWFCHGYLSLPEYFGVNTVLCTLN